MLMRRTRIWRERRYSKSDGHFTTRTGNQAKYSSSTRLRAEREQGNVTFCVAMLCDKSRALILAADKMIGIGWIETEPDITKILDLRKNWMVMFAGDDITPVANIVDRARASATSFSLRAASAQLLPLRISVDRAAVSTNEGHECPHSITVRGCETVFARVESCREQNLPSTDEVA